MNPIPRPGKTWSYQDLFDALAKLLRGHRDYAEYTWMFWVTVALIVAITGWLAWMRWQAWRSRFPCYHPQRLFTELCQAHRLDRPSRELLLQLATHYNREHPAVIFLEPHRLVPEELPAAFRQRKAEVEALREKLFGERKVTRLAEPDETAPKLELRGTKTEA